MSGTLHVHEVTGLKHFGLSACRLRIPPCKLQAVIACAASRFADAASSLSRLDVLPGTDGQQHKILPLSIRTRSLSWNASELLTASFDKNSLSSAGGTSDCNSRCSVFPYVVQPVACAALHMSLSPSAALMSLSLSTVSPKNVYTYARLHNTSYIYMSVQFCKYIENLLLFISWMLVYLPFLITS